jgi:antitoxin VapB
LDVLIKRPTAVAKIRKLAKRTGETLTDAVERAVEDRLAKVGPRRQKKGKGRVDRKRLAELLAYFDSLPRINEDLTDDEIVGYDEHGLPK